MATPICRNPSFGTLTFGVEFELLVNVDALELPKPDKDLLIGKNTIPSQYARQLGVALKQHLDTQEPPFPHVVEVSETLGGPGAAKESESEQKYASWVIKQDRSVEDHSETA